MALPPHPAVNAGLTREEWAIIQRLRRLRTNYSNFTLTVYGQGSPKRQILDLTWTPRIRLTSMTSLDVMLDD